MDYCFVFCIDGCVFGVFFVCFIGSLKVIIERFLEFVLFFFKSLCGFCKWLGCEFVMKYIYCNFLSLNIFILVRVLIFFII